MPRDGRARSITCIGLAGLDLLGTVPSYPAANTKNLLGAFSVQGGGPAATASAAAARLGAASRFVGHVADDDIGRTIMRGLEEVGVDIRYCARSPGGRSPLSFVAVAEKDGSRTVFHAAGELPLLSTSAIDWRCLDDCGVLLVDARLPGVQLEAARRAKAAAIPVVLDAEKLDDATRALLPLTDVCIASGDLAAMLGGAANALAHLLELGPTTAVVTLGEAGSRGRTRAGDTVDQPAFAVEVVDTTGCGDVYHGAYAVALGEGKPLLECMRYASAAASLAARGLGGRAALPTPSEVAALLAR
jgi:sulfofructose kinase